MIIPSRRVAPWGITFLILATKLQGTSLIHPARFGVVDIMPNEFSADNHQDSEASLAVGLNVNYGKIAVHTFSWDRNVYTSVNAGEPPWTAPWVSVDLDATLDWSAEGNCYLAMLPVAPQVQVRKSLDPTTTDFTTIDTITKGYFSAGHFPDQPW